MAKMTKKNKKILIIGIIAIVIIVGIAIPIILSIYGSNLERGKVTIDGHSINIEVAKTPETRMKGLSGRMTLAKDSGMLFVMADKRYHSFWMDGMKFPIDIIWISDNKIVDITKNAPAPTNTNNPAVYTPSTEVDKVLEVNAGYADAKGFKIGDEVGINY